MYRLPEKVHWARLFQLVPAVAEYAQIPCESSGIAAYVDDAVRRHLQHRGKAFPVTALARRVHQDHIGVAHIAAGSPARIRKIPPAFVESG